MIHFKILSMAIRHNAVLQKHLGIKNVRPDRTAVAGGIEIFGEGATVDENIELDARIDSFSVQSAAAEAARG